MVKKDTNKNELANHCCRKNRGTSNAIANDQFIRSLTSITDIIGVPIFTNIL